MRVEIPRAAAQFVRINKIDRDSKFDLGTVEGIRQLWQVLEKAADSPVEFKTGNWVLESVEELTENHLQGRWAMNVRYSNFGTYLVVDHNDSMLDFSGSANNTSHQVLAQLTDALVAEGFSRFEEYGSARAALRRSKVAQRAARNPVKKALRELPVTQQVRARVTACSSRNFPALLEAGVYSGRLFRNMVSVVVALAALTDLELLRPMVIGLLPPVVALGAVVFLWERANPRKTSRIG